MRLSVALGGSVFTDAVANGRGVEYVDLLDDLTQISELTVVVVGAGAKKQRIEEAETTNQVERDLIGVEATRENAEELIGMCERSELSCCPAVPETIHGLKNTVDTGEWDVIVMGGTEPGHSTDAVAALAAELIGADLFVNATDVNGIYTGDPDTDADAEKYDRISYRELVQLLCGQVVDAGSYALLDLAAVKLLQRSSIPGTVVDGREPVNILRAAHGRDVGTRIGAEA